MMAEPEDLIELHRARYRLVEEPALMRVERQVIGCDYGASSYTTMAQADRLAGLLRLGPGKTFLDIGCGAGWPAIYMAASTGARPILTDIPWEGLEVASRRSRRDGVAGAIVCASGVALPFRDMMFHAVTSSDVLC